MFILQAAPAVVKPATFAFMAPAVTLAPVAFIPAPDMAETDESWLMDDATADEMAELANDYASYESGCYAW